MSSIQTVDSFPPGTLVVATNVMLDLGFAPVSHLDVTRLQPGEFFAHTLLSGWVRIQYCGEPIEYLI